VYEHNRLTRAAAASRVVVDPFSGEVYEFAAHGVNIRLQVVCFQGLTAVPLADRVKLGILTRLFDRYTSDASIERPAFLRVLL
jgi:hypothetical protein